MKRKDFKKDDFVKGIFSPFVHGQVERSDKIWVYLKDGSTYPAISLQKSSKKEASAMPDFMNWTLNSKNGLGLS
jgi:hypothetical protein